MREVLPALTLRVQLWLDPPRLFDRLYGYAWYGGSLRAWAGALTLPEGARILEFGCGPGGLSLDLARRGFRVTGVDKSDAMLRRALRAGRDGLEAEFLSLQQFERKVPQESYDAVLGASLLNIVPDRAGLVQQAKDILRPGGLMSFLVPLPGFTAQRAQSLAQDSGLSAMETAALVLWAGKPPKMTVPEVSGLLRDHGLETENSGELLDGMLGWVSARKPDQGL